MKIAILGWGSLIWDPRNLEIDKTQGENGWFSDGSKLSLEFSRISKDGRLTLVIDEEGSDVQTLYAISKYEELDYAILNLAVREGCGKAKIGSFTKTESKCAPADFRYQEPLADWFEAKKDIDAVIWTNLSSKLWYKDENGKRIDISRNGIIDYLSGLPSHIQAIAEEYIRKAPKVVDTMIRRAIEEKLGWTKISYF